MTRLIDWFKARTVPQVARLLSLTAALLVLVTLADPGITVDEPLDVRPGRNYVAALRTNGLKFFTQQVSDRVYLDNKEHPPLGRWLLGIASTLGEPFEVLFLGGADPVGIYVVSGRIAPALVFAWLVGVVASEAGRKRGVAAAWAAGFSLIVMPRVFTHAHLGALDLFIAAFWSVALIKAERALTSAHPTRGMAIAAVFWSFALLTKIHAWLLPPIVLVRAISVLGPKRAFLPMLAWTIVGLTLFFIGWPWLWFDPIGRLATYLGTGVERTAIYVQYFGQVYRDRDVPWHFPWLHFIATVPVGLHYFGVVGSVRAIRQRDGAGLVLLGAVFAILAFFSTNVPVYDGERLYLLTFPLWAILAGRGFSEIWEKSNGKRSAKWTWCVILLLQGAPLIVMHPFGLSYYNICVGGLPGAERLGLELTYWSDSVDPRLLRKLAASAPTEAKACLAPTLAPSQGAITTGRDLMRKRIVLGDESEVTNSQYVVVYRRTAYWKPGWAEMFDNGTLISERSRFGVWLSRVIRLAKE